MFPDQAAVIENSWSGWTQTDVYDGNDIGHGQGLRGRASLGPAAGRLPEPSIGHGEAVRAMVSAFEEE